MRITLPSVNSAQVVTAELSQVKLHSPGICILALALNAVAADRHELLDSAADGAQGSGDGAAHGQVLFSAQLRIQVLKECS